MPSIQTFVWSMAIASSLALALTVSAAPQPKVTSAPVPSSSVVVGTLRLVRLHDQNDYEQARAMYVHTNLQPLVVDIDQTLLGPPLEGTLIVFVDVDPAPQFSIRWLGSYGILSSREWKTGERLVLKLDAQDQYGAPCEMWAPKPPVPDPPTVTGSGVDDLPELGTISLDPELNAYKGAPGLCASLKNVFRISMVTK